LGIQGGGGALTWFVKPRKLRELKRQQELEKRLEHRISAEKLTRDFDCDVKRLRQLLGESNDLIFREINIYRKRRALLLYVDGLVSTEIIDEHILRSLMHPPNFSPLEQDDVQQLKLNVLPIGEAKETTYYKDVIKAVLAGDTALLLEGCNSALLLNTKGWEMRSVQEPSTESNVRGPRDAFSETLRVNTALIRRRLKDPDLRVKNISVGTRSRTDVALIYIEGVADASVVEEVERRIKRIEIDGVLESGYIEQFIEDDHWTPFPLIQNTERPDKSVANLLEGKVVIVVDGTPFVLIVPAVLSQFYHSPEDYYERFLIATLLRFIRALSMTISLLLPSLYIAFSSFHPEMIPSKLMIAMAAGRATVPFPSVVEALAMEISIEILREASVRLPGPIGSTIGIVGALIVGEAAVSAGIVSPIMVIVVALTTIGSFAAPSYNAAIALRMLRFPMMLLAAALGLYGIMLFMILIIVHLCSLKSFGVPYLSPFTPRNLLAIGDSMIRIPLFLMKKRPNVFSTETERVRLKSATAEDIKPDEKQE
jgi:spore germination protein KA